MADSKISALTEATTLADADEFVIASSGASKRVKFSTLQAAVGGRELAYAEFTSNVTVSSGDGDSPTDVVSSGAVTYASSRICIEFFAVIVEPADGDFVSLCLWDASTRMGEMAEVALSNIRDITVFSRRYLTPTAASHTYRIRAFRNVGNGTIYAGAGGSGQRMPGYIRITTADSA